MEIITTLQNLKGKERAIALLEALSFYSQEDFTLSLFHWQYRHVEVYKSWCDHLKRTPKNVFQITDIPFLPISFFKEKLVSRYQFWPELVFTSSGTIGSSTSKSPVYDPDFYTALAQKLFESEFGQISDFSWLCLLPSYLERSGSSLIFMLEAFLKEAKPDSGFYLYDYKKIAEVIASINEKGGKGILWGVAFALLDFAKEDVSLNNNWTLIETGGMKGRKQEIAREELHQQFLDSFGVGSTASEYGMTELTSQAYSHGEGIFRESATLKVFLREIRDPFAVSNREGRGGINLIDFGNLDTCSFIQTDDIGEITAPSTFKILGRLDSSELRGCNLLLEG